MNERGPTHALGEGDDVLRADDVRSERALKRRVEGDVARAVDEHVNVVGDRLRLFFREPQTLLADVAANDPHLVAYEILEGRAVALAHGVEGRRGDDVVPEACF